MEKGDDGKKENNKDNRGYIIHIPANTIVVNTNLIHRDYSAYNIFHECVHYDQHYMFFRLQAMGSNDPRKVKVREVIVDKDQEVTDPIYFMEKQANRGAYGLMLPATDTKKVITSEYEKVENYRHIGERYEIAGKAILRQQCIPHFRIRARMIQLGFVEAKGALNYVERKLIQPFAFNLDAWREEQHTFVVDRWTTNALYRKNEEFQAVMDSGKYVYADGHVVRNDPRFVEKKGEDFFLTEWASAHVDDCCLRFVRQYVQQNVGRYVFGRMYYDADYVQQTQFYLNDLINREHLDELDAKTLYIQKFPKDFKGAIEQLKKQNKTSNAKMAEFLNMDDSTFARSLDDPKKYMNEDYLTVLCLYFKLPDWISRMVFKRAHFQMDEEDKRHQALLHILRVQSNDGVEAANEYLKKNHLAPLSF
jgi:Zn-dependent peptidase ImmA (M78 family)